MAFRLHYFLAPVVAVLTVACGAQEPVPEPEGRKVNGPDGTAWVQLILPEYDRDNLEGSYKPYTHILDFTGENHLTKGAGGRFTHHRGMYIGWNKTQTEAREYDTWHMRNCYQAPSGEVEIDASDDNVHIRFGVNWNDLKGATFMSEVREHVLRAGENGERIFDFKSTLKSEVGPIKLRGDLHHAGMQIRLANEIAENEENTEYILPEGAVEQDNDEVIGAWWVTCSAEILGKRYWVMHMTAPDLVGGVPVYSIRRYARFGAFFEPDLEEGKALETQFRILVSEAPLDQAASQARYDAYAATFAGDE